MSSAAVNREIVEAGYPAIFAGLPPIIVSPAMLAAGRAAFLRKRRQLDDLHSFFEPDLNSFLRAVYRDMARAACRPIVK